MKYLPEVPEQRVAGGFYSPWRRPSTYVETLTLRSARHLGSPTPRGPGGALAVPFDSL